MEATSSTACDQGLIKWVHVCWGPALSFFYCMDLWYFEYMRNSLDGFCQHFLQHTHLPPPQKSHQPLVPKTSCFRSFHTCSVEAWLVISYSFEAVSNIFGLLQVLLNQFLAQRGVETVEAGSNSNVL